MRTQRPVEVRRMRVHGLIAGAVVSLLGLAGGCAEPLRPLRTGVQHDGAGRPFVEVRPLNATMCDMPGRSARAEVVAAQLNAEAQQQGYSGVIDTQCDSGGGGRCLSGETCIGIAVRYVVASSGGAIGDPQPGAGCTPACTGNARCEDGQCVPECVPRCGAAMVCVQDGTCQPAPNAPRAH